MTYRSRRRATPRRERGVALAISLVLLVAMTVIGVATLSGTRLNEKITSNAQQKSVAFEVAESAIDTVWNLPAIAASVASLPTDTLDAPAKVGPADAVKQALLTDFDQTLGKVSSVNIDATVTIRYCGESALPEGTSLSADESELRMVGALFDVEGIARIAGSATRSEHVQRGAVFPAPATGRSGACVAPGSP